MPLEPHSHYHAPLAAQCDLAPMSFTLREAASLSEWQQACTLLQLVYVGDGYTASDAAATFMTPDRLKGEGALLIAVGASNVVIGAVIFLNPDSALRQLAAEHEREFRLLAVHPDARGQGVGEALVQKCIDRALIDDAGGLVIWTQPTMHDAHRLYERLGFVRVPERDQQDPRGFVRLVYRRGFRP